MAQAEAREEGSLIYQLEHPRKGVWTHESPIGNPPNTAATLENCELFGNVLHNALGNTVFIGAAWPSGAITLLSDWRIPGVTPKIFLISTTGTAWWWDSGGGGAWKTLRQGLSTTSTIWWSRQPYGSLVFIANATDGVYKYDGTTLLPIGAKLITACDSVTDWSNATSDTADFQEGIASNKVQSANPGASAVLTYNPAAAIDTATGILSGATYALTKAAGTDCYHFKVKFSNGAGSTVTAATTTFVVTDTAAKSLTWDATKWRSGKSTSSAAIALNTNNWLDVYCFPSEATEVATFNPLIVDKLEWKVTTAANQTYILVDDVYSMYLTTMPAVQYLGEWRNILFGASTTAAPDSIFWSPVRAPDQMSLLATAPIKGGGDAITALHSFFHQLTIGTEHHILTLSGNVVGQTYPAYLFDINEVTDESGISSHRSVVKANNKLYFFYLGNLMEYSGTAVNKISYGVENTLRGLDLNALQYIVGDRHWKTNQLWWTLRMNGDSVNERVLKYDFVNQALLFSDLVTPVFYRSFSSGDEALLCVDDINRYVYRQYDTTPGYEHFGHDITYTIELVPQGIGDQALDWTELFFAYLTNVGTLSLYYRLADHLRALPTATWQSLGTINQATAGELGRIRMGYPGKICQIKIVAVGIPFSIQFPIILRARQTGVERAFP